MPYIQQLLDAYGERDSCAIAKEEALGHSTHGSHLKNQRERFFDADAFAATSQRSRDVNERNCDCRKIDLLKLWLTRKIVRRE